MNINLTWCGLHILQDRFTAWFINSPVTKSLVVDFGW